MKYGISPYQIASLLDVPALYVLTFGLLEIFRLSSETGDPYFVR